MWSVKCPAKVDQQLGAIKVQNKNNKVSMLSTHRHNIGFNTGKRVKCIKSSVVQCDSVEKFCRNSNKLSNNCQVEGKDTNFGNYNVNNVNHGSNNKCGPKVISLRRGNNEIQTDCLFEHVNTFACLQHVSDNNIQSIMSDNSTVNNSNSRFDNKKQKSTHDVVPESSNTRVFISKHDVVNVKH